MARLKRKERGIENRRKIGAHCPKTRRNDSRQHHVMFRQLDLVFSLVFSAVEFLRLNAIQTPYILKALFHMQILCLGDLCSA